MRSWWRDRFLRLREKSEEKEKRERQFIENGSKLQEKLIVSCNGKPIPIRSFFAKELRQATNNYNNHYGMFWFKGSLDGRIAIVRRFAGSKLWADLAINDLVISAQMSAHSNVLKPMGCCLETSTPILVYACATNGFLSDRIYVSHVTKRQHQPMVWESRLKIARKIAHAISYLHTAFQRPVIHMGIHMTNILLDEHDVPKLSEFCKSVSIPDGETDVEADGNCLYSKFKTPEIKATGKATEKTDVYYFGKLLLELLTGEDSYNITRLTIDKKSSFIAYMHNHAQVYCINEVVDPTILAAEGGASLEPQLQAFLQLALTCAGEDPQRRPTMVDVTKELRRIESFVP